jgi:site-specific DNA-cytosine methylase
MRVLVACEYSATVRDAFRARGFDAWSCDLLPTEGDPRWHIRGDAVAVSRAEPWDLMIAHPPCTHLAVSGARHFAAKQADGRQQQALGFVGDLFSAPVKHIALENPVSIISSRFRKPDQTIQPWQFGHGETKATCLWLNNLPKLKPTDIVEGREARIHKMPPGPNRWKERSRTYQGIADAMADQWSEYLLNSRTARPSRACAAGEAFDPRVSPNPLQIVSHDAPYTGDRA